MDSNATGLTAHVQRLNALLAWWGAPIASGNSPVDGQMALFQKFAVELQRACADTHGKQMDGVFANNERIVQSYQDLLRSKRVEEGMAAEMEILATLLKGAASHAKEWFQLTEKLQECCTKVAQEAAGDLRRQTEVPPHKDINEIR